MSMGKVQMPEVPRCFSSHLVLFTAAPHQQYRVSMETLWLYPEAP